MYCNFWENLVEIQKYNKLLRTFYRCFERIIISILTRFWKTCYDNYFIFNNFLRILKDPTEKIWKKLLKNFQNIWGDLRNSGISRKKNFEKIEKNENFHFWKFPGISTSKCCREVSLGYFLVRFSGIGRETCQEANCVMKWKFFSRLMPGLLRSHHIRDIWRNLDENFVKLLVQLGKNSEKSLGKFLESFVTLHKYLVNILKIFLGK